MEEIKIYEEPLSKEEFTKHSINGSITSSPSKYHLIDIIKNLKFGRPAVNQHMMDEWIAMMELAPERGAPFSPEIVNMVFSSSEEEPPTDIKTSITVDGEALNTLLYIGDFDDNPCSVDDVFDTWEFEDHELQTIESIELFRGWSIYTKHNVNDDRMDHDGSVFDNELYFVDPDGNEYMAEESHSLFTGWDFDDVVTLELL